MLEAFQNIIILMYFIMGPDLFYTIFFDLKRAEMCLHSFHYRGLQS